MHNDVGIDVSDYCLMIVVMMLVVSMYMILVLMLILLLVMIVGNIFGDVSFVILLVIFVGNDFGIRLCDEFGNAFDNVLVTFVCVMTVVLICVGNDVGNSFGYTLFDMFVERFGINGGSGLVICVGMILIMMCVMMFVMRWGMILVMLVGNVVGNGFGMCFGYDVGNMCL